MSLSFREQAAMMVFQDTANRDIGAKVTPEVALQAIAIAATASAQILADQCCKSWGHDYVTGRDGNTTWTCDTCLRCGAKKGGSK